MAAKDLSTRQMIGITRRWLGKLRKKIEGISEVAGQLSLLEKAHDGLFETQNAPAADPLKPLKEEAQGVDIRHDDLARGSLHLFLAYSFFATTPEEREHYLGLQKTLFPLGFDTTAQTHEEESAAVELLAKRITDAIRDELLSIPLKGGDNLYDKILEHIQKGRRLGEIEDEKAEIQKIIASQPAPTNLNDLRFVWIRVVNNFLTTLELSSASEEDKKAIRRPYDKAEAVAERRKKATLRGEVLPDEDDDDDDDGTAD